MIMEGEQLKRVARRDWQESGEPQSEMAMVATKRVTAEAPRPRAQDLDRHIGERMRQRRIMLGLTQQQMADLIGVTYQQAHKYEKGINRIAGLCPSAWCRSASPQLGSELAPAATSGSCAR